MDYTQIIANTARNYGVDPRLAIEVASQESSLNPNAVSGRGAIGLFQLMPATAADLRVDPWDPLQNIDGGVRYLSQQISRFGALDLALAAYNWGPGNVASALARYGADWFSRAPSSTQSYVSEILENAALAYQPQFAPAAPIVDAVQAARAEDPEQFKQVLLYIGIGVALLFGLGMIWRQD